MLGCSHDKSDHRIGSDAVMSEKIDLLMLILQDRCNSMCVSMSSCIKLSTVVGNNYKLKPQYANIFHNFTGFDSKDAILK